MDPADNAVDLIRSLNAVNGPLTWSRSLTLGNVLEKIEASFSVAAIAK